MAHFCTCGKTVQRGKCPDCYPNGGHRQTTTERGYGHDWQKVRRFAIADQPLCVDCEQRGRVRPAREVHHMVPISRDSGRRLDRSNLLPLCEACHAARHEEGAATGGG